MVGRREGAARRQTGGGDHERRAAELRAEGELVSVLPVVAELLAVVGGDHDQSVREESLALEMLDQALDLLEADKALCSMLGEEFVDIFTKMKRYELSRFHDHVSQWESDEYLELY